MNDLVVESDSWNDDKVVALTAHRRHHHVPSPVAAGFQPPAAPAMLTFGPLALAAAVARTATTRAAPAALLAALKTSMLAYVEPLVADGPGFALTANFDYLADTERTLFAARVGAGVTDLYMNALGYAWRANAACLAPSLDPHADFIYDGGAVSGHGAVLAEAHGSFAMATTATSVAAQARRKYLRQVKPFVAGTSPFGPVIHGYSLAFGSKPGSPGAFLGLSETRVPKPKKKLAASEDTAPAPTTPTPIALATHRSNFLLAGAPQIVEWIDWFTGRGERPEDSGAVPFLRLRFAGRSYLCGAAPLLRPGRDPWWRGLWPDELLMLRHFSGHWPGPFSIDQLAPSLFAIDEAACKPFLEALSAGVRSEVGVLPERLELPVFDPLGFGLRPLDVAGDRDGRDYRLARFRDGLALLADPIRRTPVELSAWSPLRGLQTRLG